VNPFQLNHCLRKGTGAPGSPQRTWAENGFFECFYLIRSRRLIRNKAIVGASPGFPVKLLASAHFMRFSLKKTAHAVVSSAAYRKSGSPRRFRPRYALANLGHPSLPLDLG
jgi:hypothetical protein